MSHIIGRGRYARETYPGRSSGGAGGTLLRFYGGNAQASAQEAIYGANRSGAEADWLDFDQDSLLNGGALVVLPTSYLIGSFSVQRIIYGGAGPIIGDDNVVYELVQSTDGGATWASIPGGTPVTIALAPNESVVGALVNVNRPVALGALLAVRATYPANYDPQGQTEIVLFVVSVGG